MNKFLSLLEKLESEENQNRIKKINIVISFIAVIFIFILLHFNLFLSGKKIFLKYIKSKLQQ